MQYIFEIEFNWLYLQLFSPINLYFNKNLCLQILEIFEVFNTSGLSNSISCLFCINCTFAE
jgi:hypothetical protein